MVECRELPSFEMEMKKIVIEDQAKWTVNDLKRLKIIE